MSGGVAEAERGPKPREDEDHPGFSRRAAILVVVGVFLSLLMGALDNFVVLTALTKIVGELGQTSGITFVVSAYLIAATVSVPIFAKLSDLFSRRNVFLAGLGVFIAGSALAGLAQNLNELILFRGIQGFGSGGFFPVGLAIVAVLFSPKLRARITGLFSGIFGIATVAGPFLGSFIVDHTTWRWLFYINIPIGVLGIAVLLATLGPLRPERRGTFDLPGAALLTGWVATLMLALVQVSQAGWSWGDPRVLGLLATAAILCALFLLWESRSPTPLVPIRFFGRPVVAASGGTVFLSRFAMLPLFTFVSIYVGYIILHNGPSSADTIRDVLYFLVIPMVVGAALGGVLLTRVSYRVLVGSGTGLAVAGAAGLALLTASTPIWRFDFGFIPVGGIVLPLIPIGLGLGFSFAAPMLAVQFQLDPKDVGAATGLVQFVQSLGGAMGVSLLTIFQQWRFDSLRPAAAPAGCNSLGTQVPASCAPFLAALQSAEVSSYDNLFGVVLLLLIGALVFALLLSGRMPKKGTAPEPSRAT